ncbi:MAG: 1-deoxy-D-xylulose-5-phosphate reductoisomerase [Cytophagaceae bacterium]|nr:1-deoxy-D-xylulose-5-phosphate reductoisomerase [Cytophagaceae bacterium]MDW8455500.1 1-deoxy-D-xylulose-5-phosphate reductoisomerase [Cytophagaceae bacterium]
MEKNKRHIAILGSTGSIGRQALDVMRTHRDKFEVEVLTAQDNAELLIKQAVEFKPNVVVIGNQELYHKVADALEPFDIKVYCGAGSVASVVEMESIDIVLTAIVGYAGLIPTIRAIKAGKHIALANKETLVVAGDLVTQLAEQFKVFIIPVDSEHSAIFQCLAGEEFNKIEKIILTASGGPFRGKDVNYLKTVTKEQALKHPKWNMGAKITIDSATLMNKGLEVIEAKWLFNLSPEQIEVVVHPQSVIHSMVQFQDGSIKAQLGLPDMKLPIQYALSYPHRLHSPLPRYDFVAHGELTFEKPDMHTFRNLALAYHAMNKGGNTPCVLNAANEIAVQYFLENKISFLGISDLIERCIEKQTYIAHPTLDDYIATDKETRALARNLYSNIKSYIT